MEVWIRQFQDVPAKVLSFANERVMQTSEKMPTPATLQKAIFAVRAEMGQNSSTPRIIGDGTDRNGIDCVFWSDEPTERAYQAKKCPEGRAFLALMSEMHNGTFASRRKGPPNGQNDCPDCGQRFQTNDFLTHNCPKRRTRIGRRNDTPSASTSQSP